MFHKFLLILGAFTIVAGRPALAAQPLKISIPFDFKAGPTNMEAGDYQVSFPSPSAVLIQRADRRQSVFVMTNNEQSAARNVEAKLVFQRYGDRHFLSQVWSPDYSAGRVVIKSRDEAEFARRFVMGDLIALKPKL
jgi:hypothetical protein